MYTRASLTDILASILARKSARVGHVGGQVCEDCRACPARGKLNGHADILATILARKSARMSVSVSVLVSVLVPWNSSLTEHGPTVHTSQCGPALRYSVDLRIQTNTEPVSLKYGKLPYFNGTDFACLQNA